MSETKEVSLDEKYGNTRAMSKPGAHRYFRTKVEALRRDGMLRGEAETKLIRETKSALPGLKKGQPILYYDMGWRTGYAGGLPEELCLKVLPIPAYKTTSAPAVYVPVTDVREIPRQQLRKPWGLL